MNETSLLLRAAKACGLEAKPAKDGWVFLPDTPGGPVGKLWNPIWSMANCEDMLRRKGLPVDPLELTSQEARIRYVMQVAGPVLVPCDPFTGLPMAQPVAPAPVAPAPAPDRWF